MTYYARFNDNILEQSNVITILILRHYENILNEIEKTQIARDTYNMQQAFSTSKLKFILQDRIMILNSN